MGAFESLLMATIVRAPFIPTTCWIAPLIAKGQIQFRRDRLPRAADLPLHGEPAFIANRARRGDFAAQGFRERFGLRNIFGRFDAAPDSHDQRRLRQVHGGLRFFEEIQRLGSNLFRAQRDVTEFTGAFPEGCAASKSARNAPD